MWGPVYFRGLLYLKWSLRVIALVPLGVVTVTSIVPTAPGGDTAVSEVSEFTLKSVAAVEPNLTVVVPLRLFPPMSTVVPPVVGPFLGDSFLIVGGGP